MSARDLVRDLRTAIDARGDVPADTAADIERTIAYGLLAIRDRVRSELDRLAPGAGGSRLEATILELLDPR